MDYKNKPDGNSEHTLVCLSSSPSNAKIIRTAAKMVSALGGSFTALYVRTSYSNRMDEADRKRLQDHIQLAEKLGADITYIYGDDVSHQIAEYARISGVTTIVIGRNNTTRKHFWSKPTLTEQLAETAPSIDIHIIPDNTVKNNYRAKMQSFLHSLISYPRDILVLLLIMAAVTALGLVFRRLGFTESNIITIYILGVLLTSLFTRGYVCSVLASFMSVALFNFFLTEPRLTFHAYGSGYTITFAIMLAASIITGTLASKLKDNAKLSAQTAFRTKVLLDTNQLLQKAQDDDDIINTTATQIMRLLNRSVVLYAGNDSGISKGYLFNPSEDTPEENLFTACERAAAELSFNSKRRAGITTEVMSNTKCLYIPININDKVFGVIGIKIDGKPLDSNENSMLLSILGECALAINNSRNAKEKEQASVLAKNEQLRANLLRAISHDLRTPLTSISGNASNLLNNYDKLDSGTRTQVFNDIYDDSQWLISLVENLLSVTRIEDGRMSLNMSIQLIDEVIEEALRHIHYRGDSHNISVDCTDDLLLAKIDAKLIVQVIINLVDNAVKYSPPGCDIIITAKKEGDCISVCVADNGNGIPDELKPRVFDMFYTGDSKITDSRRSLGLGLALCKAIVLAHGGEILLKDNDPQGCVFIFTVPSGEVNVNE